MAFQINEKMMAQDRAIITRNKTEQDLLGTDLIKFKPGMAHYVSDTQKLWLSIEPTKVTDNGIQKTKTFLEVITDTRLSTILLDYVNRDGGANNSMRGPLHSIVKTGTAPMVIASTTKVANLNADRVDDMHVSTNSTASTIVGRDSSGNAKVASKLSFNNAYIRNYLNEIHVNENNDTTYAATKVGRLTVDGGDLRLNNISSSSGLSIVSNDSTKIARLSYNSTSNVWECGKEGSLSEIVTKSLYGHGKGINADMVDNRHVDDSKVDTNSLWTASKIDSAKAPRGFGLGTDINKVPSDNCNNINGTGFFSTTGKPVNGVDSEDGSAIIQQYVSSSGAYQVIEYMNSKNSYSRFKIGSSWSEWDKIITKNNVLEEGINILTQDTTPTNINNLNTYWFEIV